MLAMNSRRELQNALQEFHIHENQSQFRQEIS